MLDEKWIFILGFAKCSIYITLLVFLKDWWQRQINKYIGYFEYETTKSLIIANTLNSHIWPLYMKLFLFIYCINILKFLNKFQFMLIKFEFQFWVKHNHDHDDECNVLICGISVYCEIVGNTHWKDPVWHPRNSGMWICFFWGGGGGGSMSLATFIVSQEFTFIPNHVKHTPPALSLQVSLPFFICLPSIPSSLWCRLSWCNPSIRLHRRVMNSTDSVKSKRSSSASKSLQCQAWWDFEVQPHLCWNLLSVWKCHEEMKNPARQRPRVCVGS